MFTLVIGRMALWLGGVYWAWADSVKPRGDPVVSTIIRVRGTIILAYELAVGGVEALRL